MFEGKKRVQLGSLSRIVVEQIGYNLIGRNFHSQYQIVNFDKK